MNIDNIKGQFKDYARSNLFYLRFTKPASPVPSPAGSLFDKIKAAAIGAVKDFFDVPTPLLEDMVDLAVKTTKFPAIGMQNPDFEYRGFKMPTVGPAQLGEFDATFIIDHEMLVYQFFAAWLQEIIDPIRGRGVPSLSTINGQCVTAFLYQVRNDLKLGNGYNLELRELYPVNVSEISLGEDEAFMEFTVTFRYTNIYNNISRDTKPEENLSLLDKVKKGIGGLIP